MPIASSPIRARRQTVARLIASGLLAGALAACAVPRPSTPKTVYDFGPLASATRSPAPTAALPLALADMEASSALDGTAVQYRLTYANPQELRPYGLARWSMPPAQLVQQRVRTVLSAQRAIVAPGDSSPAHTLKLELEAFSQEFSQPDRSEGVVQLRATLLSGTTLVAQRSFQARTPAPTADAPGGASALASATDAVAVQLATWIAQTVR